MFISLNLVKYIKLEKKQICTEFLLNLDICLSSRRNTFEILEKLCFVTKQTNTNTKRIYYYLDLGPDYHVLKQSETCSGLKK